MLTNCRSREEAADNWDLPIEAVDEIIRHCELNKPLIEMEAQEDARFLRLHGNRVDSAGAN